MKIIVLVTISFLASLGQFVQSGFNPGASVTPAAWTVGTLHTCTGGFSSFFVLQDGNVYDTCTTGSGTTGTPYSTTLYQTSQALFNAGTPSWVGIGTLPTTYTNYYKDIPISASATYSSGSYCQVFLTMSQSPTVVSDDVYSWPCSGTTWIPLAGYTATASNWIYNFVQDPSGYTYFYDGNVAIWKNSAPGSATFAKVQSTNPYAACVSGFLAGDIYTMLWVNGNLWGAGEPQGSVAGYMNMGPLPISTSTCVNYTLQSGSNIVGSAYLPNAFSGDGAIIVAQPNGSTGQPGLFFIDTTTQAVTSQICNVPRSTNGCPQTNNDSPASAMMWLYGNVVLWGASNGSSGSKVIMLSYSNGAANTWQDITLMGTTPLASVTNGTNCTGTNTNVLARISWNPAHVVYIKGNSGYYCVLNGV